MNRRIYLIIIYVVTGFIILGVLGYRMGRFAYGCGKALNEAEDGSFFEVVFSDGNYEKSEVNKTFSEEIKELDITVNVSSLTFVEGYEWKVSYKGPNVMEPKIELDDKKLTVKQPSTRGLNIGNHDGGKLTISFPKGTDLDALKVEANVGDVCVENISADKVDLESNVGSTEFRNVTFKNGIFETNVGELKLDKVAFEKLDVTGNVGDVDILVLGSPENCSFDIEASIGEFEINGRSYKRKLYKEAEKEQTMEIIAETSVGDLSIDFLER